MRVYYLIDAYQSNNSHDPHGFYSICWSTGMNSINFKPSLSSSCSNQCHNVCNRAIFVSLVVMITDRKKEQVLLKSSLPRNSNRKLEATLITSEGVSYCIRNCPVCGRLVFFGIFWSSSAIQVSNRNESFITKHTMFWLNFFSRTKKNNVQN